MQHTTKCDGFQCIILISKHSCLSHPSVQRWVSKCHQGCICSIFKLVCVYVSFDQHKKCDETENIPCCGHSQNIESHDSSKSTKKEKSKGTNSPSQGKKYSMKIHLTIIQWKKDWTNGINNNPLKHGEKARHASYIEQNCTTLQAWFHVHTEVRMVLGESTTRGWITQRIPNLRPFTNDLTGAF